MPRGIPLSVAFALVCVCACKRSPEPIGTAPASSASTPSAALPADDGDALVIEKLRASGSDLSKPIVVDLYLYFPKEGAANSVAEAMRSDGYAVEVQAPGGGIKDWACVAKKPPG